MALARRAAHIILALLCSSAAGAVSKKRAPPHAVHLTTTVAASCDGLPGVWTGYVGGLPLGDSYQLAWRDPAYPAGSFTSIYIAGGPSWTLGFGQLTADNASAVLELDTGGTLHGNVTDNCTTLAWDNGSAWRKTSALPKHVHLVAMSHLDIGYNGLPVVGWIVNVLNVYFRSHLPRAVALADAMRARGGPEAFVYTSHSWLLDMYLHCPANFTLAGVTLDCPSTADVASMRAAVSRGDVTFHSAPFNVQYGGAFSAGMVDAMLAQPKRLADDLGVPHPRVASLRDVPGAPRSLIAPLARAGIPVLSIGVNDYAPSPALPTPCVWVEPSTNASVVLLTTGQGVGYPDNVGPDPTKPGGLAASTCVSHPASPAVLCWAFRTDNSGPPDSVVEVQRQFDIARWQWPGADVKASTFDAWWAEFEPAVPHLPVTTQEMGETWLTGFAADPQKNAFYRVASRAFEACVAGGGCDAATDVRIADFLRMLMKLPEHTWGVPSLADDVNYTNADFHAARAAGGVTYTDAEASWAEQRAVGTTHALAALRDHPLAATIAAAAAELVPAVPDPVAAGYVAAAGGVPYTVALPGGGSVLLTFDATTGGLSALAVNGTAVADAGHGMARLVYQTVNDTDIGTQHITVDGHSCCCCYGWGSMQKQANPASGRTPAALASAWASAPSASLVAPASFVLRLGFPDALHTQYGAPGAVWVNVTVRANGDVGIDVQLFNKTATRLGEALYLEFAAAPQPADPGVWLADVLGLWTDPLDVVARGSQHQHGVASGVAYVSPTSGAGVAVHTVDAPVVSPWTAADPPSTLIVPFAPLVGPVEGFASVLFSNTYNTNFPLYSTCDAGPFAAFPYCAYRLRYEVVVLPPNAERARDARAAVVKAA